MSARALAAVFALGLAASALAASRGRYGGTLRVSVAGELPTADPLLSDRPEQVAILGLSTRGVCRLTSDGRLVPVLAQAFSRTRDGLDLTLRPDLEVAGSPLTAQDVAQAWMRLAAAQSRSPYRALLFPLRREGRYIGRSGRSTVPLTLAFPWPDLERSLCHPALSVPRLDPGQDPRPGVGPLLPTRALGVYVANWKHPGGRAYADRVSVTAGDAREAERRLQLGEAEVGLGVRAPGFEPLPAAPALYATYLAFNPEHTGVRLREAVERVLDRADLTRFFVRGPSVPMTSLLPPALMPQAPAPSPGAAPAPPARELTLLYDSGSPDQQAVAERLQVKLHDVGHKVALKAVSTAQLRSRWASGRFDLMLHAVLLPPLPAPALAVALDLAGRHDLLAKELPPLGALADDAARDQAARERAAALGPTLDLVPLYAQSLRVTHAPTVAGLETDGFGVPVLDGAFLLSP